MKATGIIRRIDDLGRMVIPAELRRTLMLGEGTPIEIFVDGDNIILRRYDAAVALTDDLSYISDRAKDELAPEAAAQVDTLIREIVRVVKERE